MSVITITRVDINRRTATIQISSDPIRFDITDNLIMFELDERLDRDLFETFVHDIALVENVTLYLMFYDGVKEQIIPKEVTRKIIDDFYIFRFDTLPF